MELKDAKEVVAQAINAALLKGCYNLADARVIIEALDKLTSQPEVEFGKIEPLN